MCDCKSVVFVLETKDKKILICIESHMTLLLYVSTKSLKLYANCKQRFVFAFDTLYQMNYKRSLMSFQRYV